MLHRTKSSKVCTRYSVIGKRSFISCSDFLSFFTISDNPDAFNRGMSRGYSMCPPLHFPLRTPTRLAARPDNPSRPSSLLSSQNGKRERKKSINHILFYHSLLLNTSNPFSFNHFWIRLSPNKPSHFLHSITPLTASKRERIQV